MKNIIFIIGSGRSGTTWLHLMLGSHPQIATGQESQIFHNYFRGLRTQWEREINYPKDAKLRFHGISSYITEDQFYASLKTFSDTVFNSVFQAKPGATWLLEKSPNNSFNIDTIYKCYPQAKFIHVIRDGRDVVASMLAAGKSWGKNWAPRHAEPAAAEWKTALLASREAAKLTGHYMEVRYEDMLSQGCEELKKVFDFLALPCTAEEIQVMYDTHQFDKLKSNNYKKDTFISPGETVASGTETRSEPRDFFRKGQAGDWKNAFTSKQLAEIYYVAGDLLSELGYVNTEKRHFPKPLHLQARHLVGTAKSSIRGIARHIL